MALDFVAGCFGGCAGILVGHPLDTIKTRLQTQNFHNPQYKGTLDCFRTIVRNESVLGLYKGITSPLTGVALVNAVVFGVYGNIQKHLHASDPLTYHFLAGTSAGVVQSFICSPIELVKTRNQIQTKKTLGGPIKCLNEIFKAEGFRGVFRGINFTILRDGLAFGVYFATYEWLTQNDSSKPLSTFQMLNAGGVSGAASWFFTYPFDVIKTRIQSDGISGKSQYKNGFDCLKKSVKSEGVRFLFRGLSPTLIRAFPTNAATWGVVNWILGMSQTNTISEKCVKAEIIDAKICEDIPNPVIFNLYIKCLTDDST